MSQQVLGINDAEGTIHAEGEKERTAESTYMRSKLHLVHSSHLPATAAVGDPDVTLVVWSPRRLTRSDSLPSSSRLAPLERMLDTSLAVSIRRSSMNPGLLAMALPISSAARISPCALMMVDFFSSCALRTVNLARSACCCATCLDSTACSNVGEKDRWVMDTSSSSRLKSLARSTSRFLMVRDTTSLCVISWEALYCATTLLSTSLMIDGSTFSSWSLPRVR
mmetsp:Transcript_39607/g.99196  ORF Transcript_39607/g.99196 Transcript_39607/m.99196 type:complete len:223 (-) Transcript_39607:401-1069(-)